MRIRTDGKRLRRGASILAMLAMLMPVVMGGLAISVDLAVIVTARGQLRTAADAAAVAGANRLALPLAAGVPVAAADVTAAQTAAIAVAAGNQVLQVNTTLLANSANTNTGTEDIVVGYINPNDPKRLFTNDPTYLPYFNTVIVKARRDTAHNGPIPAFFSRVFGFQGCSARSNEHGDDPTDRTRQP